MKKTEKGKNLSVLMILAAGCMWGSMGLWVRRFSAFGLESLHILAMRVMVTVVLMGVFLLFYRKEYMKIRLKDSWCFVGTGIFSIVFFGYCYNRTIMITSMSVAAILLYTAPIFVMVISRFLFKEYFSPVKIAALFLAFGGCICVTGLVGGQEAVSMTGILTGLGSGFGYALYSIFSRYGLEKGYHPFTVTWYTFVFALAAILVLTDFHAICDFWGSHPSNIMYTIAYGIVTTVLPYILYTSGLKHVENGKASIMATVEPVVATILGVCVYQETMSFMNVVGVVLVLTAIVLLNLKTKKKK